MSGSHILKNDILGKMFGYVNFCHLCMPLNIKANKRNYRYLILFLYRKGHTSDKQRNALLIAKVLQLKEMCGSDMLGLKVMISKMKIKNARVDFLPQMKIRLKRRSRITHIPKSIAHNQTYSRQQFNKNVQKKNTLFLASNSSKWHEFSGQHNI